jgi:hypothetical protein
VRDCVSSNICVETRVHATVYGRSYQSPRNGHIFILRK